jgi:hypothetical protein
MTGFFGAYGETGPTIDGSDVVECGSQEALEEWLTGKHQPSCGQAPVDMPEAAEGDSRSQSERQPPSVKKSFRGFADGSDCQ